MSAVINRLSTEAEFCLYEDFLAEHFQDGVVTLCILKEEAQPLDVAVGVKSRCGS